MRRRRKYGFAVPRLTLLLAWFAFSVLTPVYGQGQGQPGDKTIAVFGQAIHYWDVGSGPVVVLVHGLGSRKEDWLPVLEPLAAIESREDEPGGRIAWRVDFRAVCGGIRRRRALDSDREARAGGRGGVETRYPDSQSESEFSGDDARTDGSCVLRYQLAECGCPAEGFHRLAGGT